MIIRAIAVLVLVLSGAATALASTTCWQAVQCSTAWPCPVIEGSGSITYYTCGAGCRQLRRSGNTNCREFVFDGCLATAIESPGCCSVPCKPPATGCDDS